MWICYTVNLSGVLSLQWLKKSSHVLMVGFKSEQNLSSSSSTRISWFLIHLGILQKFQKTNKGHSLGKNCEVQTNWILYLQLITLVLILSKTASSCQVSKEIRNWKKKNHVIHLGFINMFLSLLQKKICYQL